jgi:dTDP-4-dehydrorhamnose reductase
MKIKTAVIGASGFIGGHLWSAYRARFPDCVGTSFSSRQPGLTPFDIRDPRLAALRLEETGHRAVLIASAKPNIAYCEENREAAYAVNVAGTLELARQVARTSMQVIFLSSDYVFEGQHGPHDDDHALAPTMEYGRQKAEVEHALPTLAPNHLVLRLSKIYGVQKGDGTLLDEMAALLAAGKPVRAARDQVFCPTRIDELVTAVDGIQGKGLRGVINVCNPERWARADIALALAESMATERSLVKVISLYDIPAMRGRPLDTSMHTSRLTREIGARFTPLREDVARLAQLWRKPA